MSTLPNPQSAARRESARDVKSGEFGTQPHADAGLVDVSDDDALNEAQNRIHERITATVRGAFPSATAVTVSEWKATLLTEQQEALRAQQRYLGAARAVPTVTYQPDEVLDGRNRVWRRGERWPGGVVKMIDMLDGLDPEQMDWELAIGNRQGGYTIRLLGTSPDIDGLATA